MNLRFGYKKDQNLEDILKILPETAWAEDWLIVALDSSRGKDLEKSYQFINTKFSKFIWVKNGIRFNGKAFRDFYKIPGMLPLFSAIFMIDANVSSEFNFESFYNSTSESETFENGIPVQLKKNLSISGILGYFSDGCGLNYCYKENSGNQ